MLNSNNNYYAKIISLLVISVNLLIHALIINDNFYGSDYGNYIQGANSLLNDFVYSTQGNPLVSDNFRPVGYSLVIVLAKIIIPSYFNEAIIVFQSILLLLMFLYILQIFEMLNLYNPKSIYVSLFLFIHPTILSTTTHVQSDLLMSFFIFGFVFYILRFILKHNSKDLYIGILFITISLYFRPTFMYFFPILFIILYKYTNYKYIILSLLIIILVQSPWIIRNKVVLDTYKFSMLGDVVLTYFAADTLRHKFKIDPDSAHLIVWERCGIEMPYWNNKNDMDMYVRMKNESLKIIFENPEYFALSWIRGIVRVFIMPHEIYEIKDDRTIPVNHFIHLLRSNPKQILHEINGYFIYLYIYSYIINFIIIMGFIIMMFKFKKYNKSNNYLYSFLMPLALYGLLIPGPINKSHYIMPYYIVLIILVIFVLFNRCNEVTDKNNKDCVK